MFGSKLEIKRFEKSIRLYEEQPVKKGLILLYGHSLFTRCKPENRWGHPSIEAELLAKDGSQAILNHGFGTSSADDLLYYYHRMVTPYEPRALVLAAGGNDYGFGYTPEEVVDILARVIQYAKAEFPDIAVYVFASCPNLKHKNDTAPAYLARRAKYDALISELCDQFENCHCIDYVNAPFFYEKEEDIGHYDRIREDLHCKDGIHFNDLGYTLFIEYMRTVLDSLL
jgi:lysophospholipase L1-like esterase